MSVENEQQQIEDARRVESFLAEPAVKRALTAVKDRFYDEFKRAQTEDARTSAWAKSNALDALADELVRAMSNGKLAAMQKDAREHREERQRAVQRITGRK